MTKSPGQSDSIRVSRDVQSGDIAAAIGVRTHSQQQQFASERAQDLEEVFGRFHQLLQVGEEPDVHHRRHTPPASRSSSCPLDVSTDRIQKHDVIALVDERPRVSARSRRPIGELVDNGQPSGRRGHDLIPVSATQPDPVSLTDQSPPGLSD